MSEDEIKRPRPLCKCPVTRARKVENGQCIKCKGRVLDPDNSDISFQVSFDDSLELRKYLRPRDSSEEGTPIRVFANNNIGGVAPKVQQRRLEDSDENPRQPLANPSRVNNTWRRTLWPQHNSPVAQTAYQQPRDSKPQTERDRREDHSRSRSTDNTPDPETTPTGEYRNHNPLGAEEEGIRQYTTHTRGQLNQDTSDEESEEGGIAQRVRTRRRQEARTPSSLREQYLPPAEQQRERINMANALSKNDITVKIPPFSGLPTEDVEALLSNFDALCENTGKSEEYKAKNIPFMLKGSAHATWRNLTDLEKSDYGSVCEHLRLNYGTTTLPTEVSYPLLSALRMEDKGSVQAYYEHFQKLAINLDVTPAMLQAFFTNGLSKRIKEWVTIRQPNSLGETLKMAKQAELIHPASDSDLQEQMKSLMTKIDRFETVIGSNQRHNTSAINQPMELGQMSDTGGILKSTCQLCQAEDHLATECYLMV